MSNKVQKFFLLIFYTSILLYLAAVLLVPNTAEIKVDNAWVRAIPPGIKTTAAYMNIYNYSDTDIELTHLVQHCVWLRLKSMQIQVLFWVII